MPKPLIFGQISWDPPKSLRITKNRKKEGPKKTPKLSPSKNTENMLFWHRKYVILGAPGTCKIKLRLERERHFHIFTQSREST